MRLSHPVVTCMCSPREPVSKQEDECKPPASRTSAVAMVTGSPYETGSKEGLGHGVRNF